MTHGEPGAAALWLMALLGAWHGLNPGMGWLFAVALGMQEQKSAAVLRSLAPIALGHALAVGGAILAAMLLGASLPLVLLRSVVAALLVVFGLVFLVKHWHPRWVRMQVGFADLTLWSLLMASAHGAGLMVVPVLLGAGMAQADGGVPGHAHFAASALYHPLAGLLATTVHTAGYLAVTGLIAWIVYRKVGLAVLRKAWFNLDVLWAAALVVTGVVTFLM